MLEKNKPTKILTVTEDCGTLIDVEQGRFELVLDRANTSRGWRQQHEVIDMKGNTVLVCKSTDHGRALMQAIDFLLHKAQ